MANELASKTVGVYVNDGTIESPDWLLVVCTTEKSIELTIGNQEVNNDCTGKFLRSLPTDVSWSFSFSGDINTNPGNGEISSEEVFEIAVNAEVKQWKLQSIDGSYLRIGEGFISSQGDSFTAGQYGTFTGSIQGSGPISNNLNS